MKSLDLKHILFLLLLSSLLALGAAYVSQYYFNYQPCSLCLIERKPFLAITVICLIALIFFKQARAFKIAACLTFLLLIINTGIAIYHVGIEEKIFKISEGCIMQNQAQFNSVEELKDALFKEKIARCDEPELFILGLSMAAWNAIYCLSIVVILGIIYVFINKNREK